MYSFTPPPELKEAIKKNELIIFVGAGLSYNFINTEGIRLEGWDNFVLQILNYLKSKRHDVECLIQLIGKYEAVKILDLIESNKQFPKAEIIKFTKDFFDLHEEENDYSLHQNIFKLSRKIVTTNYDNAFERSNKELLKNLAYKGKNYELTTSKNPDSPLLFKLHGCCLDGDSMVIFPSDYNALYKNKDRDAEHSLLVLRNIIINKTILFIGTGMGDFQINNIFSEIKELQGVHNQKHFIITKNTIDSSLDFLSPIQVKDYSNIEIVISELLTIKEEFANKKSPETLKLEKQFEDTKQELEETKYKYLENGNEIERKDALLKRESLKYFSKGVEFQLDNKLEEALEEYKVAAELNAKDSNTYCNWGTVLGNLADNKEEQEAENLYDEAYVKYEKAVKINPHNYEAFYNWGIYIGNLAITKVGEEAEKLYKEAFDKYEKAIKIKPDKHQAFCNWGNTLGNLAITKEGEKAEELYKEAFEKYGKAVKIKQDDHKAFNNWGTDLVNLAITKDSEEAEELYNEAFEKYKKAVEIKPDFHEAYNNWGYSLVKLVRYKEGKETEELYNEAFEKYKKAIEIKHDFHEAYYNWGNILSFLAITKEGKAAEKLYNEAFEKYEKALKIKPNDHEAFYNWGNTLMAFAKTKKEEEAKDIYYKAIEKYKKSIELGGKCYNLACAYSLKYEKENALHYLDMSLENDEQEVDFIRKDEDWKHYLKDFEFIEILKKYE
ncbi:MAG: SIR2 family protein [Bacteroidales bacterium]|nr:SIR2 family protein [Bacteroidales bacterium]